MPKTNRTMADEIAEYLDEPLAILCARYWYRGRVAEVGKDFVTLSEVRAVEVTGPAASDRPQTEDPVPSDLTVSVGAIEQFCQPLWVWHEMTNVPEAIQKLQEEARKKRLDSGNNR
jgi:hypothetical protein